MPTGSTTSVPKLNTHHILQQGLRMHEFFTRILKNVSWLDQPLNLINLTTDAAMAQRTGYSGSLGGAYQMRDVVEKLLNEPDYTNASYTKGLASLITTAAANDNLNVSDGAIAA
jgi:hypothetical protein